MTSVVLFHIRNCLKTRFQLDNTLIIKRLHTFKSLGKRFKMIYELKIGFGFEKCHFQKRTDKTPFKKNGIPGVK